MTNQTVNRLSFINTGPQFRSPFREICGEPKSIVI